MMMMMIIIIIVQKVLKIIDALQDVVPIKMRRGYQWEAEGLQDSNQEPLAANGLSLIMMCMSVESGDVYSTRWAARIFFILLLFRTGEREEESEVGERGFASY